MNFNFIKFVNDLIEGLIFAVYEHLRSIWITARYPFRGPRFLAYRNLRNPGQTVGPHTFLLINLMIAFFFIDVVSPLIFTNLVTVAKTLGAQLERLANAEIYWMPIILRGLAVFISADLVLRTASLVVLPRHRRRWVRNGLLFSFGLQPLAVIVAFVYLLQYPLFSTHHELFIGGSTVAILLVMASPNIIFVARTFAPFVGLRVAPAFAWGVIAVLTMLFLVALYAEAVMLTWWQIGNPATAMEFRQTVCKGDDSGRGEVTAVIENRTRERFILPSDAAFAVFYGTDVVPTPSVETSLGKDSPFLIINDGALFWIRLMGKIPSPTPVDRTCKVWIRDGSFVKGEGSASWESKRPAIP